MKIGEYRIIPQGTWIWSIALQETIAIQTHAVVKITNTIIDDDDYFYGTLQIQHFSPNPLINNSFSDKTNGEVGVSFKITHKYDTELPFCG